MKKIYLFLLLISFCFVLLFATDEYYTVQRGDTLTRISTRFDISVNELREMNNLSSDSIRAGQRLIVRRNVNRNPIYYTVRAGDNLTSIARNHDTTVARLREWNTLRSSNIRINQRLIVDFESPVEDNQRTNFHIVQQGETLSAISRKYDIDVIDLVDFNKLTGFTIFPGQRIWLEDGHITTTSAPSVPETAVSIGSDRSITHTVRRGENLFRIALHYNVTVDDLRRWNRLSNVNIREGQILYVMDPVNVSNVERRTDRSSGILPNVAGQAILPVSNAVVISEFGMRSGRMHQGIDLRGNPGTPIFSVLPGEVAFSGVQRGFGNVVIIEHENSIMTVYGHNESNLVVVGDQVVQGQIIATMGNTGNATTYHLHFEYRLRGVARNPRELLTGIRG